MYGRTSAAACGRGLVGAIGRATGRSRPARAARRARGWAGRRRAMLLGARRRTRSAWRRRTRSIARVAQQSAMMLAPLLRASRRGRRTTLRISAIGLVAAALQQVDDRQRDLAFAQVAADRLAERDLVAGEVEQVVDELERDAEVEAVLAQRVAAAPCVTSPSMPPICAQPPNRYAVLRRMISKCSSSVMSTSPVLVSW